MTLSPTTRLLARVVPWILGLFFAASFFWDFDGLAIAWTGNVLQLLSGGTPMIAWSFGWSPFSDTLGTLPLEGLLLTTASSGLIGFFTNWLAVSMLFRPRSRRPVFGQGVVPAQRENIILHLAEAIDRELIGPDVITKGIQDSGMVQQFMAQAQQALRALLEDEEFRTGLRQMIHAYVERTISSEGFRQEIVDFTVARLREHFDSGMGGLAMKAVLQLGEGPLRSAVQRAVMTMPQGLDIVLNRLDAALDSLPEEVVERSDDLEEWAIGAVQRFVGTLDIYGMLIGQMQGFDEKRLEDLIRNSSNDQFNYIKYLGGILGFIGGLVIFNRWLALPALGGVVLLLVGLDHAIIRLSRRQRRAAA